MPSYNTGDGAALGRTVVHTVTDHVANGAHRAAKTRKKDAAKAEAQARQDHFFKGQQDHEVKLQQSSHEHEANMLKLAHTLHRGTVRSEQKAGVVHGNTTFSTSTVQANGGDRTFGSSVPTAQESKPAVVNTPKAAAPTASKPVTIGSKKPRATKAQQKPAGSTGINFQAP